MNSNTFIVGGAVFVGILISICFGYWLRQRRAKRLLITELLKGYFQGDIPADQLRKRTRQIARHQFMREAELHSLVITVFQGAVDAKLVRQAHSKEEETKLLSLLARLKKEFGLPDLYRIEPWRAGRE